MELDVSEESDDDFPETKTLTLVSKLRTDQQLMKLRKILLEDFSYPLAKLEKLIPVLPTEVIAPLSQRDELYHLIKHKDKKLAQAAKYKLCLLLQHEQSPATIAHQLGYSEAYVIQLLKKSEANKEKISEIFDKHNIREDAKEVEDAAIKKFEEHRCGAITTGDLQRYLKTKKLLKRTRRQVQLALRRNQFRFSVC